MIPASPTVADRDQLTERLLRAAVDVFCERGLDKAGVAAVARKAGVTTGAIYSRWTGKREMLLDALDLVMTAELETILSSAPDVSALEILGSLGAELLERDSTTDALLMEAVGAAHRDEEFRGMLIDRIVEQESHLAAVIDRGKAEGLVDPDLPTGAIVALCQSISLGFVMLASIQKELPDRDGWSTVIRRIIASSLPPSNEAGAEFSGYRVGDGVTTLGR